VKVAPEKLTTVFRRWERLGPPWSEDQKLATLAALTHSNNHGRYCRIARETVAAFISQTVPQPRRHGCRPTAILRNRQLLIGLYLYSASGSAAYSMPAADRGAALELLFAQVFLLGAEFTNIYANAAAAGRAPGKLLRPWRLIIVAIADCAEHDVSRGFREETR